MQLTRPKWILFDATDTLLRPTPSVAIAYSQTAAAHGVSLRPRDVSNAFAPAMCRHFGDELSSEAFDRQRWQDLVFDILGTENDNIFDALWDHFARPTSWQLYDDVPGCLEALQKLDVQLAIASNFDARLLSIVRAKEPLDAVASVFISSQIGFRKPSGRFFAAIEQQLDCNAGELLMVGDHCTNDFEAPLRAGWQAIHLDRSVKTARLPVISSLETLASLIE